VYIVKKNFFSGRGILGTLLTAYFDKDAASIGIIGGADGPTAIYVTSNINWRSILGITTIGFIIIVGSILWTRKKK
jgi:Na+-transporting methylmalonyl-CoA/oxaloacetate decarboxylase beta subunit